MDHKIGLGPAIPILHKKNIANGAQAECVRIAKYNGLEGDFVFKLAGGNKGYTNREARMLVAQTRAYYRDLCEAGIRVAPNYRIQPVSVDREHSKIAMLDQFIGTGRDTGQMLVNGGDERLVNKMVKAIAELPNGRGEFKTRILGDFKPANWVTGKDGELVLVDYFGPKRWGADGQCSPYLPKMDTLLSRESLTFLCGDRRGQAGRLLSLIRRDYPQYLEHAQNKMLEVLYHNHPQVVPFIENEIENGYQTINWQYNQV